MDPSTSNVRWTSPRTRSAVPREVSQAVAPTAATAMAIVASSSRARRLRNRRGSLGPVLGSRAIGRLGVIGNLVAHAVDREQVPGRAVVVLDLAPQVHDVDVHRAVQRVVVEPEGSVEQLLAGPGPARR